MFRVMFAALDPDLDPLTRKNPYLDPKHQFLDGQIQLILGPMFSGKSTELIRRLKRYEVAQYKVLIVKYAKVSSRVLYCNQCCGSGSESISQSYGSGSGSFYYHAKIVRKTMIPTVL